MLSTFSNLPFGFLLFLQPAHFSPYLPFSSSTTFSFIHSIPTFFFSTSLVLFSLLCPFHIPSLPSFFFLFFFTFPLTRTIPNYNEKMHTVKGLCISQPLPLLILSWEHNVPGELPDEPRVVLQSWFLPMHMLKGCTPTAWALCCLTAFYVAGLVCLSNIGEIIYNSSN